MLVCYDARICPLITKHCYTGVVSNRDNSKTWNFGSSSDFSTFCLLVFKNIYFCEYLLLLTKLCAFYRFIVTMIFVFGLDFLEIVRIFSKEELIVVPKYVFILFLIVTVVICAQNGESGARLWGGWCVL